LHHLLVGQLLVGQLGSLVEKLPHHHTVGKDVALGGVLVFLDALGRQPADREQRVAVFVVLAAILVLAESRIGYLHYKLTGNYAVASGQIPVR